MHDVIISLRYTGLEQTAFSKFGEILWVAKMKSRLKFGCSASTRIDRGQV